MQLQEECQSTADLPEHNSDGVPSEVSLPRLEPMQPPNTAPSSRRVHPSPLPLMSNAPPSPMVTGRGNNAKRCGGRTPTGSTGYQHQKGARSGKGMRGEALPKVGSGKQPVNHMYSLKALVAADGMVTASNLSYMTV